MKEIMKTAIVLILALIILSMLFNFTASITTLAVKGIIAVAVVWISAYTIKDTFKK